MPPPLTHSLPRRRSGFLGPRISRIPTQIPAPDPHELQSPTPTPTPPHPVTVPLYSTKTRPGTAPSRARRPAVRPRRLPRAPLRPSSSADDPLADRPPLTLVFVASECAPYSKAGGLGDVIAALPAALAQRKHRVVTVVPRYAPYHHVPLCTGTDAQIAQIPVEVPVPMRKDLGPAAAHVSLYATEDGDGCLRVFVDHPIFRSECVKWHGGGGEITHIQSPIHTRTIHTLTLTIHTLTLTQTTHTLTLTLTQSRRAPVSPRRLRRGVSRRVIGALGLDGGCQGRTPHGVLDLVPSRRRGAGGPRPTHRRPPRGPWQRPHHIHWERLANRSVGALSESLRPDRGDGRALRLESSRRGFRFPTKYPGYWRKRRR